MTASGRDGFRTILGLETAIFHRSHNVDNFVLAIELQKSQNGIACESGACWVLLALFLFCCSPVFAVFFLSRSCVCCAGVPSK